MRPNLIQWIPKKVLRFLVPSLGLLLLVIIIWFFWPDDNKAAALKDFITDDAAMVIQSKSINQAHSLFLADSSRVLSTFPGLDELSTKLSYLKKLAEPKHVQMLGNPFIAFWRQIPGGRWSATLVLYSGLQNKESVSGLVQDLSLIPEEIKTEHTFYSAALRSKNGKEKQYFAALKDIFVISDSHESLLAAIDQSQKGDATQSEIKNLMKSANKSAAFNAYFRPSVMKESLSNLMHEDFPGQATFLSTDSSWIIMDFMNDVTGLIINGRKQVSGGWDNFISEESCENRSFIQISRQESLWSAVFTYSDFNTFYKAYCHFPQHNTPFDVDSETEKIKETDALFNPSDDLFPAFGNSLMYIVDASLKPQTAPALVFEINDSNLVTDFLANERLFKKQKNNIFRATQPYFSYSLWGPVFAFADSSFWIFENKHLVVASDAAICQKLCDLLSEETNGDIENEFSTILTWPLRFSDHIFSKRNLSGIKNTELASGLKSISITLKRSGNTIFFHILIPLKGEKVLKESEEITCAANLAAEPLMIPEPRSELLVVYIMENHQLVIRGINGKPYSEYELNGSVVGKPVYFIEKGKIFILAATENTLYCFSSNGEIRRGFPVNVPEGIYSFLFPIDYDNDGNIRILFSDRGGKVRNFDITGKEVKGWKRVKPKQIADQIIHSKAGKKDFILLVDRTGYVSIINRKGEKQCETDKVASSISPLIVGAKSSVLFYFVDVNRNLCELKPDGKTKVLMKNWVTDLRKVAAAGNSFYMLDGNSLNEYNGKGEKLNGISVVDADDFIQPIFLWKQMLLLVGNDKRRSIYKLPGLKLLGSFEADFSSIAVKDNKVYLSEYSDRQIRITKQ